MDQRFENSDGLREQPIGELMKKLSEDLALLMRQELDLAKAELSEKIRTAGVGAGMFTGATVIGLLALAALTACIILALSHAMAPWLAAFIVAIAYGALAGVLAMTGKKKFQEAAPPVPQQTAKTLKEDVQWAKTRIKSAGR